MFRYVFLNFFLACLICGTFLFKTTFAENKLVIEVRGCFWHGHETCPDGHIPKTNSLFWKNKFDRNKERDRVNFQKLSDMGYKVFIIWECETRSEAKLKAMIDEISHYLKRKFKLYLV